MASLLFLLPLVLLWVLFIRPQQRRMREAQAMVASLDVGDEVITSGGIYGTITDSDDTSLWLEIADDVTVRILRGAVAQRVPTDLDELVAEHDLDDDDDDDDDESDSYDSDSHGEDVDDRVSGTSEDSDEGPASPGSKGLGAGVPNGTVPKSALPEPTTGDDEA